MTKTTTRILGLGLVITLVAGAAAGIGMSDGEERSAPSKPAAQPGASTGGGEGRSRGKAVASDMAVAEPMSFQITTTVTGDLQAKNQIDLNSELEVESSIVELVPEGTMVKKGDLVVRLNGDQIQTQLDEVKLRVESAKAEYIAAENGFKIQQSENDSKLRQAQLKLDLAVLDLKQWEQGERVQKLKDIELDLDKTAKDLERLEDKFTRSEGLFTQGFLSKDELQRDEIALREARAARAKAVLSQQVYNNYQEPKDRKTKESAVEEAKAELERTKQQNEIQLTSKEAERVNKKQQLALQEARQEKLQKQLAATEMRAPQDGLVIYASNAGRNWFDDSPFAVGRRVRPQETLIVLPDTSQMVAAVKVPEATAGRVRVGQPATVRVDKLPGYVFTGQVDSIGVLAETQDRWRDPNRREYTVKVLLDDPRMSADVELKPSDRAEATIVLGEVEGSIAVPLQAVFTEERLQFVWVPEGGRFRRQPVQVGRRSDTLAEVRAGLDSGTRVLLREPAAGERVNAPWDEAQLKTVGFRLADNGKPEPIAGMGGGRGGPGGPAARGGRPGGPPGGPPGGRPDGAPGTMMVRAAGEKAGETGKATEVVAKPAEEAKPAENAKPAATPTETKDAGSTTEAKAAPAAQAAAPVAKP